MKSLPLAFLIAFFMPTVFCSSLGLKGHKDVHDHAAVDVPLHQQERCHQEYDDVWEEKCRTVYEDKCNVEYKQQCTPTTERVCTVKVEEKCEFVGVQKCTSLPVPKCGIKWEKACTSVPKCKTHHEKVCLPVTKDECSIEKEEFCTQVIETVCKKTPAVKALPDKGALLNKGAHLDKGALLEKGAHLDKGAVHEKGAHLDVAPPAHHSVHRREASVPEEDLANSTKKLTPKEAYEAHKKSLEALRDKVEADLAALEKQTKLHFEGEGSQNKSVHEKHVHHLKKRSLRVIKDQVHGELELLEVDRVPEKEEEEVVDRPRRTVSGMEIIEHPKVQKLAINEKFAVPIEKGKGHARSRRSLKGWKGEQGWNQECWNEPREKCTSVPRQVCVPVTEEVCKDVPREVCEESEHCKDVPKKDCHLDYKEVCANIPTRQCHPEEREVCKEVQSKVCQEVAQEVCVPSPGKKCEKVLVKRPRTVCPPHQRVRVLAEPEPQVIPIQPEITEPEPLYR